MRRSRLETLVSRWAANPERSTASNARAVAKGLTSAYFPLSGVLVSEEVVATLRDAGAKYGAFGQGLKFSPQTRSSWPAIQEVKKNPAFLRWSNGASARAASC